MVGNARVIENYRTHEFLRNTSWKHQLCSGSLFSYQSAIMNDSHISDDLSNCCKMRERYIFQTI